MASVAYLIYCFPFPSFLFPHLHIYLDIPLTLAENTRSLYPWNERYSKPNRRIKAHMKSRVFFFLPNFSMVLISRTSCTLGSDLFNLYFHRLEERNGEKEDDMKAKSSEAQAIVSKDYYSIFRKMNLEIDFPFWN